MLIGQITEGLSAAEKALDSSQDRSDPVYMAVFVVLVVLCLFLARIWEDRQRQTREDEKEMAREAREAKYEAARQLLGERHAKASEEATRAVVKMNEHSMSLETYANTQSLAIFELIEAADNHLQNKSEAARLSLDRARRVLKHK